MEQILFNDFPNELIEVTFSFIKSNKAKRTARAVCKKWMKYVGSIIFDMYMPLPVQIPRIAETFTRCTQPFSLAVHKADSMKDGDCIKLLEDLTHMISLSLSFASSNFEKIVPDLVCLNKLTNLQRIDAYDLQFIANIQLPHLTYIEAARMNFSDPSNFPNLAYLSLKTKAEGYKYPNSTNLTTFKCLKNSVPLRSADLLTGLRELKIPSIDRFKDKPFPNLESLCLDAECYLANCPKLTKLTVYRLQNLDLISTLTDLQELHLGYPSRFPEEKLSVLSNMKQLRSFRWGTYAEGSDYCGEFLQYLNPKIMTRLHFPVDHKISSQISRFINLKDLSISILTQARLTTLSSLSKFSQLTSLILTTPSTDQSVTWINQIISLEHLELRLPKMEGPLELHELTNLTLLRVSRPINPIPDLTKLRSLDVHSTTNCSFLTNLTKLTNLACLGPTDGLTILTRLRELNIEIASNDQLVSLISLQCLTKLELRNEVKNVDVYNLTLLTRLQIVKTNSIAPKDMSEITQKMSYILPEVVQKGKSAFVGY